MATAEILAPESALALITAPKPAELFAPGFIDPILEQIEAAVRAVPFDISTAKGREAIASLSHKIKRSKTFIDEQRLALVADEKKRLKAIDVEGASIWDRLEALHKEIRKPLTDWEQAEKLRIDRHEQAVTDTNNLGLNLDGKSLEELSAFLEVAEGIMPSMHEEFKLRIEAARGFAIGRLRTAIEAKQKAEADRIELERLRAEAVERERVEREAEIARKATERAEAAERTRRDQAARDAETERQRIENERNQAEAKAKQAEAQRIAAEEAAELARIAAELKAEADREAAVLAERERIQNQQLLEQQESEARERNKRHVSKINGEVSLSLIEHGIPQHESLLVVKAIAANLIPHVKISY